MTQESDKALEELAERTMLLIEPFSSDKSRARTKANVLAALREVAEQAKCERGKCLYCDDTAATRYPVCYTHRNKLAWQEEGKS